MISRITVTNARMHNLPTVMTRATQNMHITLSAWSWSSTCQNAQLTFYDFQSRTNNGYGMISIIIVTKIPKCTTHCLWFPEKDKEWTWDDQHDHSDQHARMHNSLPMNPEQVKEWTWNDQHNYSHQHARMHNSPTMIARAEQRIVMEWSAWLQ